MPDVGRPPDISVQSSEPAADVEVPRSRPESSSEATIRTGILGFIVITYPRYCCNTRAEPL
jgi:hypothetical protein